MSTTATVTSAPNQLHLASENDYVTLAKEHNLPYPPGYYDSLPLIIDLHEGSIADLEADGYKYMHLLPYNPANGINPPLVEFKHVDASSRADPSMKNLLNAPGATFKEITPPVGTEAKGIQLLDLNEAQRDELALFVAKRGVVIFRDQNIKDQDPAVLVKFGEHFGPMHTHQFGDHVKGAAGVTSVYRDTHKTLQDSHVAGNLSSINWHTDMSYEMYAPLLLFLLAVSKLTPHKKPGCNHVPLSCGRPRVWR